MMKDYNCPYEMFAFLMNISAMRSITLRIQVITMSLLFVHDLITELEPCSSFYLHNVA